MPYTFAVLIFLILATSSGLPLAATAAFIVLLLAVCMPASSLVARLVEKKSGTLTVGGAVFVGMLASPVLIWIINLIPALSQGTTLNATLVLSAISVSYAYGEGLGRLACLSFGCCYGKPLEECSPGIQRLMKRYCLVFHGSTKKIAYASGLDGHRVIPIQVITAIIYCVSALAGTFFFLNGFSGTALVETLIVTQAWRIISEFFRADFRGDFTITPYQMMAAATVLIALCINHGLPGQGICGPRNCPRAMGVVWSPWTILALQGIWLVSFLFTRQKLCDRCKNKFSCTGRQNLITARLIRISTYGSMAVLLIYDIVKLVLAHDLMQRSGINPWIFFFLDVMTIPGYIIGWSRLISTMGTNQGSMPIPYKMEHHHTFLHHSALWIRPLGRPGHLPPSGVSGPCWLLFCF